MAAFDIQRKEKEKNEHQDLEAGPVAITSTRFLLSLSSFVQFGDRVKGILMQKWAHFIFEQNTGQKPGEKVRGAGEERKGQDLFFALGSLSLTLHKSRGYFDHSLQ